MAQALLALTTSNGVTMHETAVCRDCLRSVLLARAASEALWRASEDRGDTLPEFTPVDNPDARCNECGYQDEQEPA